MPWRRARPLRGRTCPSQPGGISSTRPVGTQGALAGADHQLAGDGGAQVEPGAAGRGGRGQGEVARGGEPLDADAQGRRYWARRLGADREPGGPGCGAARIVDARHRRRRWGCRRGASPAAGRRWTAAAAGPASACSAPGRRTGSAAPAGRGTAAGAGLLLPAMEQVDGEVPLVVLLLAVEDQDRLLVGER